MITRKDEQIIETVEGAMGGQGHAIFNRFIREPAELYGKGRVFSIVTPEKDCEIGYHVHKGDGEFYCMLSGEVEYNDNGTVTTLRAGDTSFTADGEGHSAINRKDEPASMIALVIYN